MKIISESVPFAGTDFFAHFNNNYFTCRSKYDIIQLLRLMK
ncbi:hypothetical protein [Paenibacillus sp. 7523-1]|nr:hypothetical protein [Paenibacillus sp. 7523-1]